MTVECGAQFALNSVCPGLGSIMDFGKALCEFYKGNMKGGFLNVGFGVLTVTTLGLSNSLKPAAQPGMPSKLFEFLSRQWSKLTPRKGLHNIITSTLSSGGHEVNEALSRSCMDTLFTFVSDWVLGIFKATRKDMILPVAMIPKIKLAEEAWKKYACKDLLLNYCCASLKGCINIMTNSESYPLDLMNCSDWPFLSDWPFFSDWSF